MHNRLEGNAPATIEVMGLLYNGLRSDGRWWKPLFWKRLLPKLSPTLCSLLTVTRDLILVINQQVDAATLRVQQEAKPQPVGFGALTSEELRREIGDWNRFQNRRQVASMTGMCPRVYDSGNTLRQGNISKHGNPRLRAALVEMAWGGDSLAAAISTAAKMVCRAGEQKSWRGHAQESRRGDWPTIGD